MKFIYKIFLTFNSVALMIVVFLIKEHIVLPVNMGLLKWEYTSYIVYGLGLLVFSGVCLLLTRLLSKDVIEGGIKEIELANNSYLPTYLGYFFVALSVNDLSTMICVFFVVFIFTFNSQSLFFNPMFLLFGYKFYLITLENGMRLFVVSQQEIKTRKPLLFDNLARINDYTFIDRRK